MGKEKELTIVQYLGKPPFTEEPVTVNMPIERIVDVSGYGPETLCTLGEQDRIVGVTEFVKNYLKELKTFLEGKPTVGKGSYSLDIEKIIELRPDIVLTFAYKSYPDYERQLKSAGIPLIQMDFFLLEKSSKEIRNLGWMLHKQERAEELIDFEEQNLNLIEERMRNLEEEQKPRVYYESYKDYQTAGPGNCNHDAIIMCGGINIFADIGKPWAEIDPEAVIERDPQVILKLVSVTAPCGYDITDTGSMEEIRNNIMSRPELTNVTAVKNGRVYLFSDTITSTHISVYHFYVAKWLHPELFEDIDPLDIHREWFEKFLGIEYKGVYAYPIYPV